MKKLIFVLTLGLVLGIGTSASAALVSVTATGDNFIYYWTTGTGWSPFGTTTSPDFSAYKWGNTNTMNYTVDLGQPLTLYFAVLNEDPTPRTYANPVGFLSQITSDYPLKENDAYTLLSGTSYWEVARVDELLWPVSGSRPWEGNVWGPPYLIPPAPGFSPFDASLGWGIPTSYGNNPGGWWSTVAGISGSAQWIDTNNNYPNQGMDNCAVFRLTVTPVPEPTSMSLLGLGILGLLGLKKKKVQA